jgi:hypothetical protein
MLIVERFESQKIYNSLAASELKSLNRIKTKLMTKIDRSFNKLQF